MLLFGSTLVIVIIIAIIFGIAAAGAVVFICLKKGVLSKGGTAQDAPKKVKNPVVTVLSENAKEFSGLYEPLYCCAKCKKYAKKAAVFASWGAVAAQLGQDNIAFSNAYNKAFGNSENWKKDKKIRKKAKKLLKLVKRAGIIRDKKSSVSFDGATLERYDFAGAAELTEGELLEVLAPFWFLDNEVLQKGIVR